MNPRRHRPELALAQYVECLWYLDAPAAHYPRERALPDGSLELVFNLATDPMRIFASAEDEVGWRFTRSVVCGPHSQHFVLDTSAPSKVIGVHLRPGMAARLGINAGDLANRHVAIEDVLGAGVENVREQMLEAPGIEEKFAILERFLQACLNRRSPLHPAIAHAIRCCNAEPSIVRVADLRRETGYSAKRFIALFRDAVGLTPKAYLRVRRFHSVIASLSAGQTPDWAAVAADSGYADQAHLTREFRAFAGVTPGAYQPVTSDRPGHMAIEPRG